MLKEIIGDGQVDGGKDEEEGSKTDFPALFTTYSAIWTLLFCTCPKVPRASARDQGFHGGTL